MPSRYSLNKKRRKPIVGAGRMAESLRTRRAEMVADPIPSVISFEELTAHCPPRLHQIAPKAHARALSGEAILCLTWALVTFLIALT
jgi:hypothetical protein